MDAVPSMLEYIVRGAASAVLPMNLLVMFIGLVVGIVGGMLPGITTVTAVALFVPFTFSMPPDMALIGLGGVFCGAMYGGANAAILINTPGTPGSIATSLDGYPLVMQGRAEEACYIALIASVLGGIFGTVVLMLFFEPLSVMALKFGSEAFFWMGLFGLSTLAAMFPGNIAKGLLGGAIGLALCTVGLDPVMGMPRFTFGCFDLVQGLDMVALMIGLFSLSQMFVMLESDEKYIVKMERQAHAFKLAVTDILRHLKLLSVASAIGTFIGALPGAGGSVAALVSYNEAKRWDKDPDRYGKGAVLDGMSMEEALAYVQCLPDCEVGADVPVLFGHRDAGDVQIYFLTNQSDARIAFPCTLRVTGSVPEAWDAVTGAIRPLPEFEDDGRRTTLPMVLEPNQSLFVVLRADGANAVHGDGTANFPTPVRVKTLDGPWTLTFQEGRRGPAEPVVADELKDLRLSDDESVRYFSGSVRYETTFDLRGKEKSGRLYVNTGQVGVMAKVYVNGKYAGGVWTAPYRVDVTDFVRKGKNTLVIDVVNTWVNRLVGDSRLPEDQRGTWTLNNPWRPDSQLQPSGLFNPVVIERMIAR